MADAGKWALLMSTPDEGEAFEVKAVLEAEGIACRLEHRHPLSGAVPGGKPPEIDLFVSPDELEVGEAVLRELDLGEEE